MLITNPENKLLDWKIDTSHFNDEKVFNVVPTSGRLDGGQSVVVKVSFNPTVAKDFKEEVPLYLDNDYTKPYYWIPFKGSSQTPKLTFDRREVIIPVTPLNIPSSAFFYIINDGYENLPIKHSVIQTHGPIDIEVVYPDGQTIGMNKTKLKIELKFCSAKPQSFTTTVEFYDET